MQASLNRVGLRWLVAAALAVCYSTAMIGCDNGEVDVEETPTESAAPAPEAGEETESPASSGSGTH